MENILKGNWKQLEGQIKQQWGQLTDNDLTNISGKTEELIGKLQERYGYDKQRAKEEVNAFVKKAENAKESVSEILQDVSKKLVRSTSELKEDVQEYSDTLIEYIKKCPGKSVAIAAGVGILLGIVLKK